MQAPNSAPSFNPNVAPIPTTPEKSAAFTAYLGGAAVMGPLVFSERGTTPQPAGQTEGQSTQVTTHDILRQTLERSPAQEEPSAEEGRQKRQAHNAQINSYPERLRSGTVYPGTQWNPNAAGRGSQSR